MMQNHWLPEPVDAARQPASLGDPFDANLQKVLFGYAIRAAAALLSVFLLWAVFAPLDGGALASGQVVIDGQRTPVQHVEGGRLEAIHVREGETVAKGDPIAIVRSQSVVTQRNSAALNLFSLQVSQARLKAERAGSQTFSVETGALTRELQPLGSDLLTEAQALLRRDVALYEMQMDTFSMQEAQADHQLRGLRSQMNSLSAQICSLEDDIAGQYTLLEKGLIQRTLVRRYERELSGLKGELAVAETEVSRLQAALGEIAANRSSKTAERDQRISSELTTIQSEIGQAMEDLAYYDGAFGRFTVRAPIDGQVINLAHDAAGSIIQPGGQLLEVVPPHPTLIVEARVAPGDVETLAAGDPATLMFPGLSMRDMPRIRGSLKSLSDDVVLEERTGLRFYVARVEVPFDDPATHTALQQVRPGMPVDVSIITKSRTLAQYLIEPLTGAYARAFVNN